MWPLLFLATLAAPALADTYNMIVLADSPTLRFSPYNHYRTGVQWLTPGAWNQSYTGADYSKGNNDSNAVHDGRPAYWNTGRTDDTQPIVEYTFVGTSIKFWGYWGSPESATGPGTASAGSVSLTIDGGSPTSNTGGSDTGAASELAVIAEATDLPSAKHDIKLAIVSGDVTILYAEVGLDFGDVPLSAITNAEATALTQTAMNKEMDGADTSPSIIFTAMQRPGTTEPQNLVPNPILNLAGGKWSNYSQTGSVYYPVISTSDNGGSMTVNLGTGNIFLRINGSRVYNHDTYTVTITPAPPNLPGSQSFMACSFPFWVAGTSLYSAVLDPAQNYTVTVTNTPTTTPNGQWLDIHSFELWKADAATNNTGSNSGTSKGGSTDSSNGNTNGGNQSNGAKSASTNVGAIAGGVVGGVLGLALIGVAIFFLVRRSHKPAKITGPREATFEIEQYSPPGSTANMHPTPFPPSSYTHSAYMGGTTPSSTLDPARTEHLGEKAMLLSLPPGAEYPSPVSLKSAARHSQHPSGPRSMSSAVSSTGTSHPATFTTTSSYSKSRTSVASFEQESDAGTLMPTEPRRPRQIVPPSYDPSWASDRSPETYMSSP